MGKSPILEWQRRWGWIVRPSLRRPWAMSPCSVVEMGKPEMPSATRLGSEEHMQQDVERFLQVLEAERGFSVNTIFAYRNDLTQFLTFLAGERADEGGRAPSDDGDIG